MSIHVSDTNLNTIFQNIQKHSPYPSKVQIVAVTKGFSHQAILSALSHNIQTIGENRVQEFLNKKPKIKNQKFEAHLIGHLQSNKIKKAIELFNVIETVDSIDLAKKIHTHKKDHNKKQRIYIQINIGNDPKKFGFSIKHILNKIEEIENMKNLIVEGTMTILPHLTNVQSTEKYFSKMREISQNIKEKVSPSCSNISMGMSRDYIYALKQGATHIRVGTLLYGNR